jgi:hypothetical protein
MSFNRIKYDKCAYDLQIGRSTAPGDYRLFGSFAENCDQCFSYNGPVGAKSDVSLARKMDDLTFMAQVESELSWRNQLLSDCNDNTSPLDKHELEHKPVCTNKLTSEDTRFSHPIDNFRSMSLTNYQIEPYLPVNPQCHVQPINDRAGLNSRNWTKDNYVMPDQQFWDNAEALPKQPNVPERDANLV